MLCGKTYGIQDKEIFLGKEAKTAKKFLKLEPKYFRPLI